MKKLLFVCILLTITLHVCAQKYALEKGDIVFFSEAAIEDITAKNTKAISILNVQTSDIVFSVPIQQFQFEKKLMQEHFNEKYMESETYPKSTFTGKLEGFDNTVKETQQVRAKGKLMIHGVTMTIDVPGTAEVQGDRILLKSKFIVKLADYKIKIPQLMWQNIAEEVEVRVDFTYKPQ